MTENKKEWHKPELTVFVRSRSAEAVLTPCKNGAGGSSSNNAYNGCAVWASGCNGCSSYIGS